MCYTVTEWIIWNTAYILCMFKHFQFVHCVGLPDIESYLTSYIPDELHDLCTVLSFSSALHYQVAQCLMRLFLLNISFSFWHSTDITEHRAEGTFPISNSKFAVQEHWSEEAIGWRHRETYRLIENVTKKTLVWGNIVWTSLEYFNYSFIQLIESICLKILIAVIGIASQYYYQGVEADDSDLHPILCKKVPVRLGRNCTLCRGHYLVVLILEWGSIESWFSRLTRLD